MSELDPIVLRRRIGYVPQDGGLIPHWRVERNVELVPRLLDWDAERRKARVREMLELVGLSPDVHAAATPPSSPEDSASGSPSPARSPRIRPSSSWTSPSEPSTPSPAWSSTGSSWSSRRPLGKTLVLVTHDLAEAFRLADRIGGDAGREDSSAREAGGAEGARRRTLM